MTLFIISIILIALSLAAAVEATCTARGWVILGETNERRR